MGVYADVAAALADGVIHYIPFDEYSGDIAEDFVKSDYDLSLHASADPGDYTIVDGLWGLKCRKTLVSGSPQRKSRFVRVNSDVAAAPATWSMAFWMKDTYGFGSQQTPLQTDGFTPGIYIYGGLLKFWFAGSSYGINVSSTTAPAGSWHHVIMTASGTDCEVFIDGVSAGTRSTPAPVLDIYTAYVWSFGWSHQNDGRDFIGLVQDLAFWNRKLTVTDAGNIWNSGTGLRLIDDTSPPPERVQIPHQLYRKYLRTVITGAPDSTTDAVLPVSSVNWRKTAGSQEYVSLTVPLNQVTAAAVAARPNGAVQLVFGGFDSAGANHEITLTTLSSYSIRVDEGGASASQQLSGYNAAAPEISQITETLYGLNYRAVDGGTTRVRGQFNPNVRPGDTLSIPGNGSITVDSVVFMMSGSRIFYEASGA